MDDDELLGIREMCETFDVTPRALRFYESKNLLSPERIGTKRLFTRRDRARLKLILRGKRFGFSLEEIGELLGLYEIGDGQLTQYRETIRIATKHLHDMERRRDELAQAISEIKEQLQWGETLLRNTELKYANA